MSVKHLLSLTDLKSTTLTDLLQLAASLKAGRGKPGQDRPLDGKSIAMIFSKSSTRTRVSFEVGICELGGRPMFFDRNDLQLGRGESMADTARVLSRYVHGVVIRCHEHTSLEEFARNSTVPVINALTDRFHPCQLLADLQTIQEYAGRLEGIRVAYLGDGANNMAYSWIIAAKLAGIRLSIGAPPEFQPDLASVAAVEGSGAVEVFDDPAQAAAGADFIYTDTWVSMGCEGEEAGRLQTLAPYQVNRRLLELAAPAAKVMHCLPAYREKEITGEVMDGPAAIVWDQAENRLHAQKAALAILIK